MGLLIKRAVKTIVHSDNDILSADIPREHLFVMLWLQITGTLTVAVDATAKENNILNLIKNIQIKAEGSITPKSLSAVNAYLISKYENRVAPTFNPPSGYTAAGSPYTFNASIPVAFILPSSYGRNDRYSTLFDSQALQTLQILLTTGDVDDVISAGTATLTNVSYTVHTSELSGIRSRRVDLNQESQQDANFSAASSSLVQNIPVGNLYRRFAFRVLDNEVQSESLVYSIKLKVNGTNILTDVSWAQLKDINKEQYHIETLTNGFAIIDLDERKLFAEMLDTRGISSLKIEYGVNAPAGANGRIEVVPSEILINPANLRG